MEVDKVKVFNANQTVRPSLTDVDPLVAVPRTRRHDPRPIGCREVEAVVASDPSCPGIGLVVLAVAGHGQVERAFDSLPKGIAKADNLNADLIDRTYGVSVKPSATICLQALATRSVRLCHDGS